MKALSNIKGHIMHVADSVSDFWLAWNLYFNSRDDLAKNGGRFIDQDHIAFSLVGLAILGPYIIQYSSLMNAIHHKGYFKKEKFKKFGCLKRAYLYLAFTFIGLLIMPTIDFFLKVESIIKIFSFACYCKHSSSK